MVTLTEGSNNLPLIDWEEVSHPSHFVQFYEDEAFLISSIREFIAGGDATIIVATQEHCDQIENGLQLFGLDLAEARAANRYFSLDGAGTLAKFMVEGLPEPGRFFEIIGGIVARASVGHQKVRIFGEMVALLWAEGNSAGAIKLEALWNELNQVFPFALFCAYPLHSFGENSYSDAFAQICNHHSNVLPTESFLALQKKDSQFKAIALLQQKARALEAEIERRKQLEKQKEDFIAIITHELKTPVTSIKGYTQLLQNKFRRGNDFNSAEMLGKMNSQLDKLIGLISDLLDVSKIEGGQLQFRKLDFDFNDLVLETLGLMEPIIGEYEIITQLDRPVTLYGDRERIGQVIANLITNAVKYSPPASKLVIKTGANEDSITFSLKDQGIGLSREDHTKIFERFYRVSGEGLETYPGLGLGLYICSEIITRHKGRIWVESEKGNGALFCFALPLHKE